MRYVFVVLVLIGFSCSYPGRKDKTSIPLNGESSENSVKNIESEEELIGYEKYPVFVHSDEMDSLGEGTANLKKFFREHLTYPQSAIEDSIEGRVSLSFVIEADGSVSNVSVLRGVRTDLDNECIRVAHLMPKWAEPAKLNGKPVRISYSAPIIFSLKKISNEFFVTIYPNQKLKI